MNTTDMTDPWIGSTSYAAYCRPKLSDLLESLGLNVAFTKAKGAYLYREDNEGNEVRFLDLSCSIIWTQSIEIPESGLSGRAI